MCEQCSDGLVGQGKSWVGAWQLLPTWQGLTTVTIWLIQRLFPLRLIWSWLGQKWNEFGGFCWGHCSV